MIHGRGLRGDRNGSIRNPHLHWRRGGSGRFGYGFCRIDIATEVNVLAISSKLALVLHVKTAQLADRHALDWLRGAKNLVEKSGSAEGCEWERSESSVGVQERHRSGRLIVPCGRGIAVSGAAIGSRRHLTKLLHIGPINVNLVALYSGVAALLLEEQAQRQVLGDSALEVFLRATRRANVVQRHVDLTRAIRWVDYGNAGLGLHRFRRSEVVGQ